METSDASNGSSRLLDQVLTLWVIPEMERQGLGNDVAGVDKALVVFPPQQRPRVTLNEEVQLIASVKARGPIDAGEAVTTGQMDELEGLRPLSVSDLETIERLREIGKLEPSAVTSETLKPIDPNDGWLCFSRVGEAIWIGFDFRRNRKRAWRLLDRAAEFCATAVHALDEGLDGPAVENAFAGAELAITAQMLMFDDSPPRNHIEKRRRWRKWTELGNAPESHSKVLSALLALRKAARYEGGPVGASKSHVTSLIKIAKEMVGTARTEIQQGPIPVD